MAPVRRQVTELLVALDDGGLPGPGEIRLPGRLLPFLSDLRPPLLLYPHPVMDAVAADHFHLSGAAVGDLEVVHYLVAAQVAFPPGPVGGGYLYLVLRRGEQAVALVDDGLVFLLGPVVRHFILLNCVFNNRQT